MKKLLLAFVVLFITGFVNAQIVNIPDENFKERLLLASPFNRFAQNSEGEFFKIDNNDDGEIQASEALEVSYLDLIAASIANLEGIEDFINIKTLGCDDNLLMNIDISGNTNLEFFSCENNQLSTLDISKNTMLSFLICRSNFLASIDITKNLNLEYIDCYGNLLTTLNTVENTKLKFLFCSTNSLTSLDIGNNINLENLNFSANQLTSIDVSKNVQLKSLLFVSNSLTSLNVSNNIHLETLACISNELNTLDVSNNINLQHLSCSSNKLTTLDVSNNTNLNTLECSDNELETLFIKNGSLEESDIYYIKKPVFNDNPNLHFICADEEQIETVKADAGNNVLVTSYCSFKPGGDYNTVSGTVRHDDEIDGCDVDDSSKSNIKINLNDGTDTGATFTNTSGEFSFYTNTGDFIITPELENPSYFTISPETISINFTDESNILENQNFCISPNGIKNDLEIVITPIEVARPGFDAAYKIVYKNKGNQTLSGSVDFVYDDSVLDYIPASINPDTQSTGNLSWNYTNLEPFESRSFEVTLNVNSPMETPAVNNDDILIFTATINPIVEDETEPDNVFEFNQIVVGSYDPNDITCLQGDSVLPEQIGEYLHYHINFENTGTAAATFVIVKDIVDLTKFDINSLQILDASHTMETKVVDGKIEFIFDNINLGANEKGNIIFKIKSLNTLVIGDSVTKKADIYFDYNFPIETNIANTRFETTLSNKVFKIDNSISAFPNPTKSILNVKAKSLINSIEIYDVQGRIVLTKLIRERTTIINISSFKKGIYFLKIKTEAGEKIEKVIKD